MLSHVSVVKLLSHLSTERFLGWLTKLTGETPPENLPTAVRAARSTLRTWLATFDAGALNLIDQQAERILQLTDRVGCEIMAGLRCQLSEASRTEFAALPDQYQRSLWLAEHQPSCFTQALDARDAENLRTKVRCWTGFLAPAGLTALQEATALHALTANVAVLLDLPVEHIAVQVFIRSRGADRLVQISVHYNRPAELIDQVQQGELIHTSLVRALAAYVTYEPGTGALEVLSPDAKHREAIARAVADTLLNCAFDSTPVPLKRFDYQKLARPLTLDLGATPEVFSAAVASLSYIDRNRLVHFALPAQETKTIHEAAKDSIQQFFNFSEHTLSAAKIQLRIKPTNGRRARTLVIALQDTHRCNTKSMPDTDRALCDRLLAVWGLVSEIATPLEIAHVARAA